MKRSRRTVVVVVCAALAVALTASAVASATYTKGQYEGTTAQGHAINNTALVCAALHAFDRDYSGGICAAVQGGLDTDTNGAAVGSILGAVLGPEGIDERWTAPLHGRFSSSLPGFDGATVEELVERTVALIPAPAMR